MGVRSRVSMAVVAMSVVSLRQGLDRWDPRMPGDDEKFGTGMTCDACGEPLRSEPGNTDFLICKSAHLTPINNPTLGDLSDGISLA